MIPNKGDTDTIEIVAAAGAGTQPPQPYSSLVRVDLGALSHTGKVRANNEDHYLVIERRRTRSVLLTNLPAGALRPADDVGYLWAVADGMGGEAFGELASALALTSAWATCFTVRSGEAACTTNAPRTPIGTRKWRTITASPHGRCRDQSVVLRASPPPALIRRQSVLT